MKTSTLIFIFLFFGSTLQYNDCTLLVIIDLIVISPSADNVLKPDAYKIENVLVNISQKEILFNTSNKELASFEKMHVLSNFNINLLSANRKNKPMYDRYIIRLSSKEKNPEEIIIEYLAAEGKFMTDRVFRKESTKYPNSEFHDYADFKGTNRVYKMFKDVSCSINVPRFSFAIPRLEMYTDQNKKDLISLVFPFSTKQLKMENTIFSTDNEDAVVENTKVSKSQIDLLYKQAQKSGRVHL